MTLDLYNRQLVKRRYKSPHESCQKVIIFHLGAGFKGTAQIQLVEGLVVQDPYKIEEKKSHMYGWNIK